MNEYKDIINLLKDLKDHKNYCVGKINQNDFPSQLKLGYVCEACNKDYLITLSEFKKSLDELKYSDETKYELISKAFQTQEGKENLLKAINK